MMGCDQTDTSGNANACGPQKPLPSAGYSEIENQAAETSDDPIIAILEASGLTVLKPRANPGAVEDAVRALAALIAGADDIRLASVREAALKKLAEIGISAPARLIDAAMVSGGKTTLEGTGPTPFLPDPSPWESPIDSCELLDEVAGLIRRYVVLSNGISEYYRALGLTRMDAVRLRHLSDTLYYEPDKTLRQDDAA